MTFDLVVNFAYNSDTLTPSAKQNLDEFVKALRDPHLSTAALLVEGHTDAKGSEPYNLALSGRRAAAVVRYLGGKGGRHLEAGCERLEQNEAADAGASCGCRNQPPLPIAGWRPASTSSTWRWRRARLHAPSSAGEGDECFGRPSPPLDAMRRRLV